MVKVTKFYDDKAPEEAEIRAALEAEGLTCETWAVEAGTVREPETKPHDQVICVVAGMARITLPDSPEEYADLLAGDRLDLPTGTRHGLMAGPAGVRVVEATKT